jgi:hypothetical protein
VGRSGFCIGAPTEEEAYLAAGAPGYGDSAAPPSSKRLYSAPPPPPGSAGDVADASNSAAGDAALRAQFDAPGEPAPPPRARRAAPLAGPGALVRVSTGAVARSALPAFVRVWQLLALPAYAAAPGCASARLVVGEDREGSGGSGVAAAADDAAARAAATRAAAAGPRGGLATVVAITEWADEAALEAAAGSPAYAAAMAQLATHFRGAPSVATLGQEGANVFQRGEGEGAAPAAAPPAATAWAL